MLEKTLILKERSKIAFYSGTDFKQNPLLSFRELRNKADIQFGDNGTTISAVSNKAYVFERNQSVGDPKVDLIRTLNIPAVVSKHFRYHYCGFEKQGKSPVKAVTFLHLRVLKLC